MESLFNRFLRPSSVYVLVTCLTLLFSSVGLAQIPNGWESYLSRPDILQVSPKKQTDDKDWGALKAAHFSLVAELLALYSPDTHIFFLARDSEHLYDVARLVTQGTADQKRMHLLNISRGNMRDKNMLAYLAENGISEESIAQGKKVLFVDTGFAGTIPRVIGESFSEKARAALKTHLVVSSNPKHPSSRTFLLHLNPSINDQNPSLMHGSIINYEHMPRYTDRSSTYVREGGRLHPISPIGKSTDGSVSKEKSLQYIQDLRAEWENPKTRQGFKAELEKFKSVAAALKQSSPGEMESLKQDLINPERFSESDRRLLEAFVRDALDAQKNAEVEFKVTLHELGLHKVSDVHSGSNKKHELIEKYPEWKNALENPDAEIPELVKAKNWQMLGNLIDADVDSEINKILVKALFSNVATGAQHELQKLMIDKGNPKILRTLAEDIFSKPYAEKMSELIRAVIEKGNPDILDTLAIKTFSQPHTRGMKDLLKLIIETGGQFTLERVVNYVFIHEHAWDKQDLLKILIQKGDDQVHKSLSSHLFQMSTTKDMREAFQLLIEEGSWNTLQDLKKASPIRDQRLPKNQVLLNSLSIRDNEERKAFMENELKKLESAPHTVAKEISAKLVEGDKVVVNGTQLTVIKKAGEGRRGVVFLVQDDSSKSFALKTAKDLSLETLQSLEQESEKAKQWKSLKIPHAKVLVQEKTYVLKEWVDGQSGNDVIEKYASGDKTYKKAADYIMNLVAKIRAQGAYVGDFRPANLIWNGKAWVIIDSGSIQKGLSFDEAQTKWSQADERGPKFERRWKLPLPAQPQIGPMKCEAVFMKAG